jgi:hypothetical protein
MSIVSHLFPKKRENQLVRLAMTAGVKNAQQAARNALYGERHGMSRGAGEVAAITGAYHRGLRYDSGGDWKSNGT